MKTKNNVIDIIPEMTVDAASNVLNNLEPIFRSQIGRMIHTVESMGMDTKLLAKILKEERDRYEQETYKKVG